MKAGRELDALVAEKVMGWKLFDRAAMGWGPGPSVWSTGENSDDPMSSPTFQGFQPSVDIRHAWLDVKKMAELHVVSVSCMFNKRWRCEAVQAHSQRQTPVNAIADTAPLAICLAALKAVGVEVEE